MEQIRKMSIPYSGGTVRFSDDLDDRFARGVLWVAYHGQNRNGSRIRKEDFERNADSAKNVPIVCNYIREEHRIGGHDEAFVEEDGELKRINLTRPVGIVPESARYWWAERDDGGVTHEYFCLDALIWKREEPYEMIQENRFTSESMEIAVRKGGMNDGVYDIFDFDFTAFCLLGQTEDGTAIEPCFEGAGLSIFHLQEMDDDYRRMLDDMKKSAASIQRAFSMETSETNNAEGGTEQLDKKNEMLAKFGLTVDDLDFSLEDAPMEGLEDKLRELSEKKTFHLTASQTMEALSDALSAVTMIVNTYYDGAVERPRYIYIDHDDTLLEVYCYNREDWKIWGFSYTVNGDSVKVDFTTGKRKKISYTDMEDGDPTPLFSLDGILKDCAETAYAEAEKKFVVERESLEEKFASKEQEVETLRGKVEELASFKASIEQEAKKAELDTVFAKFDALNGNEVFEALKGNCEGMTADEAEEKCYAICGRFGIRIGVKEEPRNAKYSFASPEDTKEPYGGLVKKYR